MEQEKSIRKGAFGDPRTEFQILFAKRLNVIALIVLMVFLGSTFFYFIKLNQTKRKLETSNKQIEAHRDSLEAMQARQGKLLLELKTYKDTLAAREERASLALTALVKTVEAQDYSKARRIIEDLPSGGGVKVNPSTKKPIYLNVYFYQVSDELKGKVNTFLSDNHYPILSSSDLPSVEKWMSPIPTVEYYGAEAKTQAIEFRKKLSNAAGINFELAEAPSNVDYGQQDWINVIVIGTQEAQEEIYRDNAPYLQIQQKK